MENDMSKTPSKKALADWRASRVHEMTLPSGLAVKVRDVTMTDLLFTGKLPPAFADMAEKAAKDNNAVDLKEMFKNAADFAQMLDALVSIALVEPKIGEFADDDTITLGELPNDDKMFIFNWANREVSQLTSFREG
jgi:hypothetical protein